MVKLTTGKDHIILFSYNFEAVILDALQREAQFFCRFTLANINVILCGIRCCFDNRDFGARNEFQVDLELLRRRLNARRSLAGQHDFRHRFAFVDQLDRIGSRSQCDSHNQVGIEGLHNHFLTNIFAIHFKSLKFVPLGESIKYSGALPAMR